MSVRTILLAAVIAALPLPGAPVALAEGVVTGFSADPLVPKGGEPLFFVRGPGSARFVHDGSSAPRFPGDPRGSLAVTYDSLEPTTRLFTILPEAFTQDDDFVFGAILTVRGEALAADPFGFHPIAFSLFNSATTGDDRTGDLNDFSADTFDTLEMSYFPNVSPLFGGPWFSPDAFGGQVAPDAFDAFAFASVPFELRPDVTYLVELRHTASTRTLAAQVWLVRADGRAVTLPAGSPVVDLSGLGGFVVDSLGISAYFDGFNEFSLSGRSLLATVDYDLLYAGRLEEGRPPAELARALRRLKRTGRLLAAQPASR